MADIAVFTVLMGVLLLLLGVGAILALSWRDSRRAIAEFLRPLKWFRRPRFRLSTLLVWTATVACLAASLDWSSGWLLNLALLLLLALPAALVLTCFVLWFLGDLFERGPKVPRAGPWPPQTEEEREQPAPKPPRRVRIKQKHRRIWPSNPFRW